jgi:hypothetical protein
VFSASGVVILGNSLSAISSREEAKIRFANQAISTLLTEKFQIITLNGTIARNTARLRKIVGWVEALRNPTKPTKCWVLFLNPTYMG